MMILETKAVSYSGVNVVLFLLAAWGMRIVLIRITIPPYCALLLLVK